MNCPKCGFDVEFRGARECPRCGVIFAKWFAAEAARGAEVGGEDVPEDAPAAGRHALPQVFDGRIRRNVEEELAKLDEVHDGKLTKSELTTLGIGLALAIVTYAIPFTRFVFSAMVTLFHEFGHAVAGWLLGYFSLPAFDLVYGGGITHMGEFRVSLAVAVAGLFGWLAWIFRENRKTVALIAVFFFAWLFVVTGSWRRELVIASAGHAMEFILAGTFFYMAISGTGFRYPEFERPLGAFVAFFVQIHSTLFALRLLRDQDFVAWYREGKGGMLMNDLEQIALDLQIHLGIAPGLDGVARGLLLFSVFPTIVALIWFFQRSKWHRVLKALRTADA